MSDEDTTTTTSAAGPTTVKPAGTKPAGAPADERTVIDAVADLLQTIVDWLRQEAEAALKEKIVLPLQALGFTLFFGLAASGLIMAGLIMISVASLLLLAGWLGWPGALYLIGGLMVVASTIALYFRQRTVQK